MVLELFWRIGVNWKEEWDPIPETRRLGGVLGGRVLLVDMAKIEC